MKRVYIVIDFKSFFASVEAVERGLDPFVDNLVVADPSRGNGGICLAITPAMKMRGVKNRCRIFEIPKNMKYITALPRMQKYIDYAANIYGIYLKYISKDDIHVYSIDEAFLDVTKYLKMYNMNAVQLARKIMNEIQDTYKIPSSCGIGTNMYLAKVALDILSKDSKTSIAWLNEEKYIQTLSKYTPLTDFWQIGNGIENRLKKLRIYNMEGIRNADPKKLYKEFGINAEFLIDHAHGIEPCTIEDIKAYKTKSNSISNSQILFEDYNFEKAKLALKEMVELLSLKLVEKNLVTDSIKLNVGYSKDILKSVGVSKTFNYQTNIYSKLSYEFVKLFEENVNQNMPIRKLGITFNRIEEQCFEQINIFENDEKNEKEINLEKSIVEIKSKLGKNAILRGMNLEEGATTKIRNKLIGGHNGN